MNNGEHSATRSLQQLDSTEFRRALGAFTTGVTVVTTRGDGREDIGLTANSFNSVSLQPPMVLWSLAKAARSLEAFKACRHFAIHILADDQEPLSARFAQRGADKFAGLAVDRGPDDIPLLQQCAARFVCRARYQYEGGDHLIFVGEVIDFEHWQRAPLLFHGGAYGQIRKRDEDPVGDAVPDDSLGYLLRLGYRRLIGPLTQALAERDLTLSQHYFLAHLARSGSGDRQALLASLATTGTVPVAHEIEALVSRGFIVEECGAIRFTPAGLDLRIELAAIYKAVESRALDGMGYTRAQSLKVHLGQLIASLPSEQ